jgi:phasin family protein
MINVEQFAATNKANLDNLFGLSNKAFAGVEKLVELNLTAGRAALNESAAHAQAVLAVKDAQEFIALQTSFVQPLAEKSAAYSRHLYDLALIQI